MAPLPPGSAIGILGGGQLGRMLAIAAAQLGYRVHVYAPDASGPAADVAAAWTQGRYDDDAALARFAGAVDRITYEFENLPAAPIARLAALRPLSPSARSLEIAQDRAREKTFAAEIGAETAAWRAVDDRAGLDAAIAAIGTPAILKTRRLGYDGKGQARLHSADDADAAWATTEGQPAILERMVAFEHEYSILIVRGADGATALYPPPLNIHVDGILARSTVPAPPPVLAQREAAEAIARAAAEALDHVGVLTIEFFAGADGPIVNELAPRVHNSGHWTIEGAETSQFENHVRAVCGLPLGSTAATGDGIVMDNLIGADVERWPELLAEPGAHLHLYGKQGARPGRKMGHVTRVRAGGTPPA